MCVGRLISKQEKCQLVSHGEDVSTLNGKLSLMVGWMENQLTSILGGSIQNIYKTSAS